ncbi:MAG: hypothetical protein K9H64_12140 [Bacteroidales bacterium]|nr:hypothetical protein [Bacteroidales bacterium]MCF8456804.1 hypothetical protein [Bacteroidales bacterium]
MKRKAGKGMVLISLEEYNSILENVHLLSSKANADWLYESIQQRETLFTQTPPSNQFSNPL